MMQVAAWFVVGVAWPAAAMFAWLVFAVASSGETSDCYVKAMLWFLLFCLLSSGVAVAATAVALGVVT